MINAAIAGPGWWGQTLVEGVSKSDSFRFVAGVTHSSSDRARAFASSPGFSLRPAYEVVLGDPNIDAVVLVTPNSLHADQVVVVARAGKHIFSFQVFGSKGFVRLDGKTHEADASSEERRTELFNTRTFKPIKGPAETVQAEPFDVTRAALEAFARAAAREVPPPIPPEELVHGVAVTEAIITSATSHRPETV